MGQALGNVVQGGDSEEIREGHDEAVPGQSLLDPAHEGGLAQPARREKDDRGLPLGIAHKVLDLPDPVAKGVLGRQGPEEGVVAGRHGV